MSMKLPPRGYLQNDSLSRHGSRQRQRRCIPPVMIDMTLDFGVSTPAGSGAERYDFDKRSWRKAVAHLGPFSKNYERFRSIYVIVADGVIVTVAWRH